MKHQKKIEVGSKIGKLEVIRIDKYCGEILFSCRCKCGQAVAFFASSRDQKRSCIPCADRPYLKKFNVGDVVVYIPAFGELPQGQQAIVNRVIETKTESALEVEYRGKLYKGLPSSFRNLGINFYDSRRTKKIR